MKKILILGGITHMLDVVKEAKNKGLYTIVCDYSPTSPAKLLADKAYDISTIDIDALETVARENEIDAVFAGFEDLNTWNALELCKRLNLPFYATRDQLFTTSNKANFKQKCREAGVPVVPEYKMASAEEAYAIPVEAFPVIIKPVDNYGSKGITVCKNADELYEAYSKAVGFSKTQSAIVEHFVKGYGVEMYYTIVNGAAYLSAMTDRYVVEQGSGVPPLPTATIFPSKHLDDFCKGGMDEKMKNLIRLMQIKNGLVLFQAVLEDDHVYVYEMAYRLTGEQHYQIIKKETGLNLMQFMIDLSLGNDVSDYKVEKYGVDCLPTPACNYAILLKAGKVSKIQGLEDVIALPEVVSYVQTIFEGDEIETIGNYGQIVLRLNIVAGSQERLLDIFNYINNNFKVLDPNGEDLILTRFESKDIFKK